MVGEKTLPDAESVRKESVSPTLSQKLWRSLFLINICETMH